MATQSQAAGDKSQLALDLEVRNLKYQLEKETEDKHVVEKIGQQLQEQIERLDERLNRWVGNIEWIHFLYNKYVAGYLYDHFTLDLI